MRLQEQEDEGEKERPGFLLSLLSLYFNSVGDLEVASNDPEIFVFLSTSDSKRRIRFKTECDESICF